MTPTIVLDRLGHRQRALRIAFHNANPNPAAPDYVDNLLGLVRRLRGIEAAEAKMKARAIATTRGLVGLRDANRRFATAK